MGVVRQAESDHDHMHMSFGSGFTGPREGAVAEVNLHAAGKERRPEYADLLALGVQARLAQGKKVKLSDDRDISVLRSRYAG